jgi:hypothetical protein
MHFDFIEDYAAAPGGSRNQTAPTQRSEDGEREYRVS